MKSRAKEKTRYSLATGQATLPLLRGVRGVLNTAKKKPRYSLPTGQATLPLLRGVRGVLNTAKEKPRYSLPTGHATLPLLRGVRGVLPYALLLIFLTSATHAVAQTGKKQPDPPSLPKPTNYKVLEERKDKDGNTIRTIQYDQGNKHIKEVQIIKNLLNVRVPISADTMNKDSVLILVNKSDYLVEVYYRRKLIRAYKAVFGPKPQENKMMSGDRRTPEGWFTIRNKNPNSKYNKFMLLDYPNDSSVARFNRNKESGYIPKSAQIGGDVGIHGIWKGGDDMIEKGICWTDGCVALRNKDMDELYTLTGVGTRVYIKK